MRQSKVFEWIMLTLLTVNSASVCIIYLPKGLISQSIGKMLYTVFFGPTQIMFMTLFYFQMRKVNEQFYRLFQQINDKSYPNKLIKVIFFILFCSTLIQCTLKVSIYFFDSIKLVYTAVLLMTVTCEGWFFVMFTVFMLYLADAKYDKKLQNTFNQQCNNKIQNQSNISNLNSSNDTSLLLIQDCVA